MGLCTFFGVNDGTECAAWVQAWGSVAAIFVAGFSLWLQQAIEARRRNRDRLQQEIDAVSLAYNLVTGSEQAALMIAAPGGDDVASLARKLVQLQALSGALAKLDLTYLNSYTVLEPLLVTQMEVDALLDALRRAVADQAAFRAASLALVREEASAAAVDLTKRAELLHKEHGSRLAAMG